MRISTATFQQASLNGILDQQVNLSKTQQQLATGKRMLTPSDDPIASATLVDISQSIATFGQYNRNADYADMRLRQEESVLNSVSNALHRSRELAVQANNDTYTGEQRKYIASEVRQILNEVLTLANTADGSNNYIFAGSKSNTKPFVQQDPGEGMLSTFAYHGDQLQRKLQIGSQRTVADGDSGLEVFSKVRVEWAEQGPISELDYSVQNAEFVVDGHTVTLDKTYNSHKEMAEDIQTQLDAFAGNYIVSSERGFLSISNNQPGAAPVVVTVSDANALNAGFHNTSNMISVFEAIDRLAVALETNEMSGGRIADLDSALTHIIEFKSTIGARMNSVDRQRTVNDDMVFQMTNIRSELEDLDYADAISKMNLQMVGMQAAQQTFTKVQNLSLFNYL